MYRTFFKKIIFCSILWIAPSQASEINKKELVVTESIKTFYDKKHVLVTGGAGFIGSHLVEALVSLGAKVSIIDNFSSGNLANLKSIAHQVNIFYADIRSFYSCLKATAHQDIVFHMAAFISVPESIKNPDLCNSVNRDGTENLLKAAVQNNVKTVVFSSSSAVYGNKNTPCIETDKLNPQSPYASSKAEGEALCKKYAESANINTVVLRYFNVYGERQNPNGAYAAVVPKFKELLKAKKPLTVFGDGMQTRDFVPVSKVVEANLTLGSMNTMKGDLFNIGTGKSITLHQLIDQLEQELGIKNVGINYLPAREGDILHSSANCDKYKNLVPNKLPKSKLAKSQKTDTLLAA